MHQSFPVTFSLLPARHMVINHAMFTTGCAHITFELRVSQVDLPPRRTVTTATCSIWCGWIFASSSEVWYCNLWIQWKELWTMQSSVLLRVLSASKYMWDLTCLLQLLTWLHMSDYHNFWKMEDGSLLTHILAWFNCFTNRNLFQNGYNDISKMVNMVNNFLSKSSKFCVLHIIRFFQISPTYGKHIYKWNYK